MYGGPAGASGFWCGRGGTLGGAGAAEYVGAMSAGCGFVPPGTADGVQRVRVRPPSVCGSGSVPPHSEVHGVRASPPCCHGDQAQGAGTSPLSTWERARPPTQQWPQGAGSSPLWPQTACRGCGCVPPRYVGAGLSPHTLQPPGVRVRPPCGHCRSATGAGTTPLGMWEWVSPPLSKVPRERVRPPCGRRPPLSSSLCRVFFLVFDGYLSMYFRLA